MKRWLTWVKKSGLSPMRKVGKILTRHQDNILIFCWVWVANGLVEGLNSKIIAIKGRECGCRDKEHIKTAMYFLFGGLEFCPKQA